MAEDAEMAVAGGRSVQFFYEVDLTNPEVLFAVRRSAPGAPALLLSHGWLDGTVVSEAGGHAEVAPHPGLVFVDRKGKQLPARQVRVPVEKLREPSAAPLLLSLVFVRWGGQKRVGESSDPADDGDGGWGGFGCPPCDWYIAAVVEKGVMRHPRLGAEGAYNCEILSLFLSSTADVERILPQADAIVAALQGNKRAGFWMLWPAEWAADWTSEAFAGYVERRPLFAAMQGLEYAGLRTGFPHPAVLYELITSKAWMATLSEEHRSRLPAAVLVDKADIQKNPVEAAGNAMSALEAIREKSVFAADGGPGFFNRAGLKAGVVKLGWSWEAKHVWFWTGRSELTTCLREMLRQPGCLAEQCIVQEWVDFDFELRLFFLPPAEWRPPAVLKPVNFEYTAWGEGQDSPGRFLKPPKERILQWWAGDQAALDFAHARAEEVANFLIGWLLTMHPEPVPMIRMDFMLKRTGPGKAQVLFGEFCEMGACCLKWEEGPPRIWRAALDYALR